MRLRLLAIPIVLAALAGCAGNPFQPYAFEPGTPGDVVRARAGAPTRVVPLPQGGQRLQYSLQPQGRQAWMIDLDPAGRVVQVRQALNEQDLNRIQPGWTREDVEREFGPPGMIEYVASWRGPIMTYRWRDVLENDMFYWVYLDERGVVGRAHPGREYTHPGMDAVDSPGRD